MYLKYLKDSRFFDFLYKIDMDLAKEYRQKASPCCKSPCHFSNYQRKPRRFLDLNQYLTRFSLCCSKCRHRVQIPSTLFFNRFVYGGLLILLLSCFLNKGGHRFQYIQKTFGISHRTLKRWVVWWNETFRNSKFWKEKKALFIKSTSDIPIDIIASFSNLKDILIFFSHFKT